MIVEESYSNVICPANKQHVTLKVGYDKIKASPKDIGFTFNYIGTNCDFIRQGEHCPYVECPLVEKLNLKRSIYK